MILLVRDLILPLAFAGSVKRLLALGAKKNCNVPCSNSNCTRRGTSLLICKVTSLAKGADLAKLVRYFKENVRETCRSRMIYTPGSSPSSFLARLLP